MRWSVEIEHLGDENADLKDIFAGLGCLVENVDTPAEEASMTCISHPMFDALNVANEVHLEARKLLKQLRLGLHMTRPFYELKKLRQNF